MVAPFYSTSQKVYNRLPLLPIDFNDVLEAIEDISPKFNEPLKSIQSKQVKLPKRIDPAQKSRSLGNAISYIINKANPESQKLSGYIGVLAQKEFPEFYNNGLSAKTLIKLLRQLNEAYEFLSSPRIHREQKFETQLLNLTKKIKPAVKEIVSNLNSNVQEFIKSFISKATDQNVEFWASLGKQMHKTQFLNELGFKS